MRAVIVQPWISYRGAETVSVLQTYWLQKLGNEATMVCAFREKTLPPHATDISYFMPSSSLQRIFRNYKSIFYIASIPVLLSLLLRHRSDYDVVIAHNYPSLWVGALAAKMCSKKLLWYVHGGPPQSGFPRNSVSDLLWNVLFDRLDIHAAGMVDRIIAVSVKIQKEIKKRYNLSADVIYPPIDRKLFSAKSSTDGVRKALEIPSQSICLLQVSSLAKEKYSSRSIRVLRNLRKRGIDVYLIIVGVGEDAEKTGVGGKYAKYIRLVGYVSAEKLKRYYALADCVIAPSKISEGCSAVPLQALFSGTESVVLSGSGVDEVLGKIDVGECVGNSNQIESAVKSIIDRKNSAKTRTRIKNVQKRLIKLTDPSIHVRSLLN